LFESRISSVCPENDQQLSNLFSFIVKSYLKPSHSAGRIVTACTNKFPHL
jgi:ATP-binding cassette subfamily G (WHITE) protein 2 (PDR)